MNDQNDCKPIAASPYDLQIAKMAEFGERVWKLFTQNFDELDQDTCEEVMEIALELGLTTKVPYDPEIHGDCVEDEPGQDIWWWGGNKEQAKAAKGVRYD